MKAQKLPIDEEHGYQLSNNGHTLSISLSSVNGSGINTKDDTEEEISINDNMSSSPLFDAQLNETVNNNRLIQLAVNSSWAVCCILRQIAV